MVRLGWVGFDQVVKGRLYCISVYFFFKDIFVVASCGSLHFKNNSHFVVRARIGKVRLYQVRSARIIFIIVPCDQTGSFFFDEIIVHSGHQPKTRFSGQHLSRLGRAWSQQGQTDQVSFYMGTDWRYSALLV